MYLCMYGCTGGHKRGGAQETPYNCHRDFENGSLVAKDAERNDSDGGHRGTIMRNSRSARETPYDCRQPETHVASDWSPKGGQHRPSGASTKVALKDASPKATTYYGVDARETSCGSQPP